MEKETSVERVQGGVVNAIMGRSKDAKAKFIKRMYDSLTWLSFIDDAIVANEQEFKTAFDIDTPLGYDIIYFDLMVSLVVFTDWKNSLQVPINTEKLILWAADHIDVDSFSDEFTIRF